MRHVVLILGILSLGVLMVQSFYVGVNASEIGSEALARGAAIGRLAAVMFGVGAAFSLTKPFTSMIIFGATAVLSLLFALPTGFEDLLLWGIIALILTILSFFCWKNVEDLATFIDWTKERIARIRERFTRSKEGQEEDSSVEH